jgi:hypothetical protein
VILDTAPSGRRNLPLALTSRGADARNTFRNSARARGYQSTGRDRPTRNNHEDPADATRKLRVRWAPFPCTAGHVTLQTNPEPGWAHLCSDGTLPALRSVIPLCEDECWSDSQRRWGRRYTARSTRGPVGARRWKSRADAYAGRSGIESQPHRLSHVRAGVDFANMSELAALP